MASLAGLLGEPGHLLGEARVLPHLVVARCADGATPVHEAALVQEGAHLWGRRGWDV
jgi:hypothetical protein